MNKQAIITFEMLMWIPRIIFLVFVMFAVIILIRSFIVEKVDVAELEANIFANRLLYSPNSISFTDHDTGRVYPGIIDSNKFKAGIAEQQLAKSIYYGNSNRVVGAKIALKNMDNSEENVVFYNKEFYDEKKILVDSRLTEGPGGARSYMKKLNVLNLDQEGSLHKAVMNIDIIMSNS